MANEQIIQLGSSTIAGTDAIPFDRGSDSTTFKTTPNDIVAAAVGSTVLAFTGAAGCQVDHGYFWLLDSGSALGDFWWEAWVKPLGTGYLISDGYGGAHALLWGFTGSGGGPYTTTGNIWNGSGSGGGPIGNYSFANGEWAYIAVGLNSGKVYTWVNGVGDSVTAFSGTRENPAGASEGTGKLYVGGSDHLNLAMRLAALRGFDRGQYTPNIAHAFAPERFWSATTNDTLLAASFCCDYTVPSQGMLADLSDGEVTVTSGSKIRHHGRRMDVGDSADAFLTGIQVAQVVGPTPPSFVADSGCPYGQPLGSPLPTEVAHTPGSVPGGAIIFDSFGRRNQTYAFQAAPSLGSTEGGSAGSLVWTSTHARPTFGILGGRAVFIGNPGLGNGWAAGAYVDAGTANVDVRVTRGTAVPTCGIIFRLQDASNFWFVWVESDGVGWVGKIVGGSADGSEQTFDSSTDAVIRVVANSTTITIYTGNGSSWTQRIQLTGQTTFQTATKVGLSGPHSPSYTPLAGFSRYGNFTVFTA